MSEEKSNMLAVNNVKVTKAMLTSATSLNEMLSLDAIEQRWVSAYEKISGKEDGQLRYEAEKVLFTQAIVQNQKAFDKCDRYTVYAAWIEHAVSGLTLRDGLSYIIPYGNKAQWAPGWKGRLEQINEMQDVVYCHEPVIVYDCDEFEDSNGMQGWRVEKHTVKRPRPAGAKILLVYMIIQFSHGAKAYKMEADEVINIRDTYSDSYKSYAKLLANEKNRGKKLGDVLIGMYKDQNQQWKEYSVEPPMWLSDEAQAFKKTLVKRVYNNLPKLPKHKAIDEKLAAFYQENPKAAGFDPDEKAAETILAEGLTAEEISDSFVKEEDSDEGFDSYEEVKDETADAPASSETVNPNIADLGNPNESF